MVLFFLSIYVALILYSLRFEIRKYYLFLIGDEFWVIRNNSEKTVRYYTEKGTWTEDISEAWKFVNYPPYYLGRPHWKTFNRSFIKRS